MRSRQQVTHCDDKEEPVSPAGREDIFERARAYGLRRLSLPPLMRAASAVVAGVVIAFGIVGEASASAAVASTGRSGLGALVGAPVFAVGLTLLLLGGSSCSARACTALPPLRQDSVTGDGCCWADCLWSRWA